MVKYTNMDHKDEIEYGTLLCCDFKCCIDPSCWKYVISKDGKVTQTKNKGLTINAPTFTASVPQHENGYLNNTKWLSFYKKEFHIKNGELLYEGLISYKQLFCDNKPIPDEFASRIRNINEDLRLSSGGLVVSDTENGLVFKTLLTNDSIYAYYEKRPCGVLQSSSFVAAALIGKRDSHKNKILSDYVRIGIGIDAHTNCVNWYINGCVVFKVNRPGIRLSDQYMVLNRGGNDVELTIKCVRIGFGYFDFLDLQLPNNYSREYINNEDGNNRSLSGLVALLPLYHYKEPYSNLYGNYPSVKCNSFAVTNDTNKFLLFGQGGSLRLQGIIVKRRNLSEIYKFDTFVCNTCKNTKIDKNSDSDTCYSSNDDMSSESYCYYSNDDSRSPSPKKKKEKTKKKEKKTYHKFVRKGGDVEDEKIELDADASIKVLNVDFNK